MLTLAEIEREIKNVIAHGNNRQDVACLADLYVCRAGMQGEQITIKKETPTTAAIRGDSAFYEAIKGKDIDSVFAVIDELLDVLEATNPRLYDGVMQQFDQI